jgi:hypothetical protein
MFSVFATQYTDEAGNPAIAYSVEDSDVARTNEVASGFETRDAAWEWANAQ